MRKLHILYYIAALSFTLGIYRGQLALWKNGQVTPLQIYPVRADSLPEADWKLLENGIVANDISELTARLEDYLS